MTILSPDYLYDPYQNDTQEPSFVSKFKLPKGDFRGNWIYTEKINTQNYINMTSSNLKRDNYRIKWKLAPFQNGEEIIIEGVFPVFDCENKPHKNIISICGKHINKITRQETIKMLSVNPKNMKVLKRSKLIQYQPKGSPIN